MRDLGAQMVRDFVAGDLVLLLGELGAGKTTLVRGMLEGLGYAGAVRSPTFNLLQTFPTDPPVLHADLYRVKGLEGLGMEDYLSDHLCLIEWPERAPILLNEPGAIHIRIDFASRGRTIEVQKPPLSQE